MYVIGAGFIWFLNPHFFEPFLLRAIASTFFLFFALTFVLPKNVHERLSGFLLVAMSLSIMLLEFFIAKEYTFQASWLAGTLMMMMLALSFLQSLRQTLFFLVFSLVTFIGLLSQAPSTIIFTPQLIAINATTIVLVSLISGLLRRSYLKEQFRQQTAMDIIFSNLEHGVIFKEKSGEIFYANKSAEKILGLQLEEFLGRSHTDPIWKTFYPDGSICPPEGHPCALAQSQGKKFLNFKLRLQKLDNSFADLSLNAIPVFKQHSPEVSYTIVTIQDETEQIRLVKTLEALNRSLDMASRLASIGKMATHLAAEVKSPLSEIQSQIQSVKTNHFEISLMKSSMDRIEKSVKTIDKVASSLHTLHLQSTDNQFSLILAKELLEGLRSIFTKRFADNNIEYTYDAPNGYKIECNQTSLALALEDLIDNSIEAIQGLKEKWIHISISSSSERTIIRVIDSGHGIPEQIRSKILQPFFYN